MEKKSKTITIEISCLKKLFKEEISFSAQTYNEEFVADYKKYADTQLSLLEGNPHNIYWILRDDLHHGFRRYLELRDQIRSEKEQLVEN